MRRPEPFPNKDRKDLFLTLLKVMGGQRVSVSFSGGGDSGSIDSAELLDSDGKAIDLSNTMFEWETESSYHDPIVNDWRVKREVSEMPIGDILVKITEDCLEQSDLDWYNNEGGQGSLEIDLMTNPATINLNVEINYTHTESHNFDFTDGEDEGEPTQYADLDAEDKAREELLSLIKGGNNAPTSP